ncbi:MAG: asparagine synthetase B, partial [Polaribacter sp.]|nr:asparagine synthetase B [Polaribacter sp.]
MKKLLSILAFLLVTNSLWASFIYIPMSAENQKNHLKAYGIVFFSLQNGIKTKWLLNYDGGAFLIENSALIEKELKIRGVSYQILSDAKSQLILQDIASPSKNQEAVTLEKAPKIAVYSPKDKMPWDDAVTMVLKYAEIPFDVIYDEEVLSDKLLLYEWLHLHHEDFTGQYGRFYGSFRTAPWYIERKQQAEALA